MTLDEVIQLGEEIQRPDYGLFHTFEFSTWLWVIGLILVGFALIILSIWGINGFLEQLGLLALLLSIAIAFLNFGGSISAERRDYKAMIEEWREEVAIPFIESLPIEKREIVYIKIDPELTSDVNGSMFLGTGYTHGKIIERTPMTVSFKDNGVVTRTSWFETFMELTDEERPYIEFQRLHQDLGHGIDAGDYNSKVYLPDSYQFTEIK